MIPWSPLARGLLAGTRKKPADPEHAALPRPTISPEALRPAGRLRRDRGGARVAERRGVAPAQVALAWLLSQPGVTSPIIGATKMAHLETAFASLDIELSKDDIAALETPYQPHGVRGYEY